VERGVFFEKELLPFLIGDKKLAATFHCVQRLGKQKSIRTD